MSSKEYQAAWHQANKDRRRVSIKAAKKARQEEIRVWLHELKSAPCTDCKNSYPYYVMDWDHVRGKKLFNISAWKQLSKSKKQVEDEVAKCELVCRNCHAVRTWERMSL